MWEAKQKGIPVI